MNKLMLTPLIVMIHRVKITNFEILPIYYQRKMVVEETSLFHLIDCLIATNHQIGTIQEAIKYSDIFHITFDDGFQEHLIVAEHLKAKYNFLMEHVTFAINVGNSYFHNYSGMDVIYKIIERGQIKQLLDYLHLQSKQSWEDNLMQIKKIILSLLPEQLQKLYQFFFSNAETELDKMFLLPQKIQVLSTLFDISSHGVTHRDLTYHPQISKDEIRQSKKILENIIGRKITTFSYPEGKNNQQIQSYCYDEQYDFSLSIRHEENNPYCIGRFCINNHSKNIMRRINE